MKDVALKKAYKIADKYLRKAEQIREQYGYRENLGYDAAYQVKEEIHVLNLSYSEQAEIMDYFYRECDRL